MKNKKFDFGPNGLRMDTSEWQVAVFGCLGFVKIDNVVYITIHAKHID